MFHSCKSPRCLALLILLFASRAWQSPTLAADPGPNVLFIAVDDLRPALGCYGDPVAITPNIDRLASRGVVFRQAYCQEAVCAASRLSLLTGLRPDTIRVWDLKTHFRDARPGAITLPQAFKNASYRTQSVGKIFHGNGDAAKDPVSWSIDPLFDLADGPKFKYATAANLTSSGKKRGASEAADVPDDVYGDGQVCNAALQALDDCVAGEAPFFLAVGFRKPHLPFCAPQKYWDLYDRDQIPLPVPNRHPTGAPELATRSWDELEGYRDIPKNGKLSEAKLRELRHGYYACVSYTDALVGRLLDALDEKNLADNTVIALWGDHGFHLGEQALWTKANNYELSTRAPLIIAAPQFPSAGEHCDALVEFVDIYPTLAEVCGVATPDDLEGVSLKPALLDPQSPGKSAVFSQYPRSEQGARHEGDGDIMGYALRTERFRYVQWRDNASGQVVAVELYDHQIDPGESHNRADDASYAEQLADLSQRMQAGWRAALPVAVSKHQ